MIEDILLTIFPFILPPQYAQAKRAGNKI